MLDSLFPDSDIGIWLVSTILKAKSRTGRINFFETPTMHGMFIRLERFLTDFSGTGLCNLLFLELQPEIVSHRAIPERTHWLHSNNPKISGM